MAQKTDLAEELKISATPSKTAKVPSRIGVGEVEAAAPAPEQVDPARFPPEGYKGEITPEGRLAGAPPLEPLPGSFRGPTAPPVQVNPAALGQLKGMRIHEKSNEWTYEVANEGKMEVVIQGGHRTTLYKGDRIDFACHVPSYKAQLERQGVKLTKVGAAKQ